MKTGDVIRHARKTRRLSQAELARRAGTSQPAIARLEAGRQSPTVDTLERLLVAAGQRLVLSSEPIESGVDPTLIAEALAVEPRQRLRRIAGWANGMTRMRRAMRQAKREG